MVTSTAKKYIEKENKGIKAIRPTDYLPNGISVMAQQKYNLKHGKFINNIIILILIKYAPLIKAQMKEFDNGTRTSRPVFIAAAASHAGEVGPEVVSLIK